MKPKFKEFYPIILIDEQTIQIGDEPNNAFEINDPDGIVTKLIPLLNGELNTEQIFDLINEPSLNFSDFKNIIETLDEIGLITDCSFESSEELNEWQHIRYNNNLKFFNIFSNTRQNSVFYQKKLIDTKVLVLGMGGLGSNLLMQLSGLGVGNIKFLDCDEVELKNLNRQVLYSEKYIGHRKTKVGFDRLSDFNTSINYEVVDKRINSPEDLENVITEDIDFVFCAADNPPMVINSWVNEICIKNNVPFLSGGVGLTCGSFYSIIPSVTPCLECYYSFIKNQYSQVLEAYENSNIDYNAAILPNISMLASMITTEFLRIHLQIAEPISLGKKAIINFLTSEITFENPWVKNDLCRICSKEQSIVSK
ncbi:ThiF family adenylyltransferase [Lysinibacillus parviboronicapiens]|uniref:ThiF family adenylyltransferase n=1 Tax=Lysinibacillus parviboronicapiens TaxID=436516 RepID=UPI000D39EC13|nr:ThiF family adenylyltransferase [Lysinibacillus parviboronicapiens]